MKDNHEPFKDKTLVIHSQDFSSRYQNLLFEKANLQKLLSQLQLFYLRVFGDLKLELFQCRVEMIKTKKEITWIQKKINTGSPVQINEMEEWIDEVMKSYQADLEQMSDDLEAAKSVTTISVEELRKVKRLFRRIAKAIHPDLHPDLEFNEGYKELWERTMLAYECNDLKSLEELDFLVSTLSESSSSLSEYNFEDWAERIHALEEEIRELKEDPLFDWENRAEDDPVILDERTRLKEEIEKAKAYLEKLKTMEEDLLRKGENRTWPLN